METMEVEWLGGPDCGAVYEVHAGHTHILTAEPTEMAFASEDIEMPSYIQEKHEIRNIAYRGNVKKVALWNKYDWKKLGAQN